MLESELRDIAVMSKNNFKKKSGVTVKHISFFKWSQKVNLFSKVSNIVYIYMI